MSLSEENCSTSHVDELMAENLSQPTSSDSDSEENCPRSPSDELMAQCLTELSILDSETIMDIENSLRLDHIPVTLINSNENEMLITDNIDSTVINDGKLKVEDCNIACGSTSVDVAEKVNESPTKKNRRRLKNKDFDVRADLQNGLMGPVSSGSFSVHHLNEVFRVWGSETGKQEMQCQNSANISSVVNCKQVKGEGKEGKEEEKVNSVGTSESVVQGSDENLGNIKHDLKQVSTSKICQNAVSRSPAVPGKSKSAGKRRKAKRLLESTKKEIECEHKAGNSAGECSRNVITDDCKSIEIEASGRPKYVNTKKNTSEERSNVKVGGPSQAIARSLDELCQLMKGNGIGDLTSEMHHTSSSNETPGSSHARNDHFKSNIHDGETNTKSKRKTSQEFNKQSKMTKKTGKQQDSVAEGQIKTRKKMRPKNKKENANSSRGDMLDDSGTPSSKQKAGSKDQKNKPKNFEEYWALDAVKIALQKGEVIEGAIRINPKRFTEAYISSPTGGQDILIDGLSDRNRALDGDLVAVLLKDCSQWKVKSQKRERKNSKSDADTSELNEEMVVEEEMIQDSSILEKNIGLAPQVTGKVVAILSKQHARKCVGYLKLMKKPTDKFALFSPRDARVPRMQIPHNKCPPDFWLNPASKESTLYLGKMVKWTSGTFALGEIIKVIGETASVEAETEALLLDNDLDVTPYPEDISKKFAAISLFVSEEELKRREDLRKECIFTIDPLTAKDLDDAVSCKELENGNLEIGVHISDVTYFLEENTPLDETVSKRATSIYLVDKVHHMLPVELCLLCSLLPGQDKLAYSVIWEISKDDAEIVSQRIVRSVIHSSVKLAYEHAQVMIENPDGQLDENDFPAVENGFTLSDISKVVNNLQLIAQKMRSKRFEGGALRIDQKKLYMQLDPSGMPFAVHEYINKESNRLIEEFMLLANMTTAKFVYDKFPDIAFLRCHPEPHKWLLEQLQDAMASRGIHLNITSAGALQASLARYSGSDYLSQTRLMVLNSLCAKTMTRAKYCCSGGMEIEDFWHYALSVPFYTHFTSPIRRYADIMVHRLLNAALGYCSKPLWGQGHVAGIAANCNKKKYCAKLAGEQSVKLYLSVYLNLHQPVIEEAVVIDVKDSSFDIVVCKYGLTMRVYISKLDAELESCPTDKTSPMKLKWGSNKENPQTTLQVIDIFTIVKVRILCESSLKLEAILIHPAITEPLDSLSEET